MNSRGISVWGGEDDGFTIMDYLKRQGYNTTFEINNYEYKPYNSYLRNTFYDTTIETAIDLSPVSDTESIINEEIQEDIDDNIIDNELPEDLPENYYDENDILNIPITARDPDSYFADFLERHYAAVIIQERWREYYLYQ